MNESKLAHPCRRLTRLPALAPLLALAATFAPMPAAADPIPGRAVTEEVFYSFMPIAWRDSNNDAQRFGDFGGMTASLDYLSDLGVTAVWMNPIFPTAAYHGYQHGPGDQLNSWLGSEAEFLNFVQEAHARDIKVFVDFVVYGISQNSTWYQSAFNNPASPYDTWLAFTNAANTSYLGSTYNTWNGSSVGFIHWNLDDPNPKAMVTNWALKWLDPDGNGDPSDGIDGYRLDHVWENYGSGPNGWGYNLDDFWMPWHAALRALKPDVFTFAEQADWGITGANLMPAFDSTFTKPWEFAVRDALANEIASPLYSQTLATLAQRPPGRHFLGIVGDHDVDRIGSIVGGNTNKAKLAAAILLTSPFPPIIYYGDEIGMLGTKNTGYPGDAADIPFREPFKWNAVAGPPMSNYFVLSSPAYNGRISQNNDGRSVQEQTGVSGSLLETYRQLIALRKAHVALRRGDYIPVSNNTTRGWAFVRHQPGEETIFVAARLRNTAFNTIYDLSGFSIPGGSSTVEDLQSGQFLTPLTDANKGAYAINMPAHSFRILKINAAPIPAPTVDVDGVDIPTDVGPYNLAATQNNATALGDNIAELNQLYVRVDLTGLRVGLTGNLPGNGTALAILIDSQAGGQNVLNTSNQPAPPGGLSQLTGLQLDAGFEPDHLFYINTASGNIYVDQVLLPAASPSVKTYRGQGTVNDGDGFLSGGTNPNDLQVAMNNTNALGVTASDASGAATATNGFDLVVPFADIGVGGLGGSVKIAAFILQSNGAVSNQWLPGLGGGFPNLGIAPDLTGVPGDQFVTIELALAGDVNADTLVDAFDTAAFIAVMLGQPLDPAHPPRCDINRSGAADAEDIAPFVGLTVGPP